jgi:hypothetical protein
VRRWDKLQLQRADTRFYYFQLRQTFRKTPFHNDTITAAVRSLGGRTVSIFSAGEFAAGLKQLEEDLGGGL